ncbi:hypothetical protein L1987_60900 [Smallanthus sonchifolius]|uniref:Uncharacterized protein n=1 Tax=Smallanthus sonchifolius TaxID=185202 RepID=A0ACB9D9A2_9ASTR|nr:hypothetical protein L1987_60900 [Smallanthus sonchifolius]
MKGSIPVGASLTATDDVEPWLSPSGDFAFGFKQIQGKDTFVLSIWYAKIPDKTIIWYPQTYPVVSRGSKVELGNGRGLILSDPQGREVWSSRSISDVAYGVMNDTGNFVIVDRNSSNIWQSFNNPADTMLPTQFLERGGVINSKLSQTNFSRGRFQLRLLQQGNLVLNSRDIAFDFATSEEYYHRATLDSDGLLTLNSCKEDWFCAVAIYNADDCWKKQLPLINGRKGRTEVPKALVKFRKGEVPHIPTKFPRKKKDQKTLITIISTLLGSSVFVNVMLIGLVCLGFFMNYQKDINHHLSIKFVNTNLPHFTHQELVEATNVFKEELGKGAFGIVYKGVIGRNTVAVKKLDRVFDDSEKEFQTEVNAIARTHHKNLVQLLGYCDEGEQRLLVYEYMSNGTLASFLFGDGRPSWKQRSNIAIGIAKGLSYLHEECSTQVIHCDIKPHNILLDEYYNAKISEFGLAKLLMMNESRTNTRIRGTKGYVAPEWFRNTAVTIKVDVYSFGVLLLEIISCRRSVKNNESGVEYGAILTDWAWDCYQEWILDAFVENDMEAIDDYKKLTTFVMVGLWCVQENPSKRPTMRKVIQMLEGVIEVSEPPCPFPFSVTSS